MGISRATRLKGVRNMEIIYGCAGEYPYYGCPRPPDQYALVQCKFGTLFFCHTGPCLPKTIFSRTYMGIRSPLSTLMFLANRTFPSTFSPTCSVLPVTRAQWANYLSISGTCDLIPATTSPNSRRLSSLLLGFLQVTPHHLVFVLQQVMMWGCDVQRRSLASRKCLLLLLT